MVYLLDFFGSTGRPISATAEDYSPVPEWDWAAPFHWGMDRKEKTAAVKSEAVRRGLMKSEDEIILTRW